MRISLLSIILCALPIVAHADIYERTSPSGVIELTSTPSRGYHMVMRTYPITNAVSANAPTINKSAYSSIIEAASTKYDVPAALVRAVITAESGFDPRAVSDVGAMGLMQLMPATASRFGVDSPFNPRQNIFAGTKYLGILLKYFGSTKLAVAAYNSGRNAVVNAGWRVPPYAETMHYVPEVLRYYSVYK